MGKLKILTRDYFKKIIDKTVSLFNRMVKKVQYQTLKSNVGHAWPPMAYDGPPWPKDVPMAP